MSSLPRLAQLVVIPVTCLTLQTFGLAQVNVTTFHNDNARTGQNTHETILAPANVNYATFGRLFSVSLDGHVYAQPLVQSSVSIGGGTHNVAFVATEHDSLYAIDANSGAVYWGKSFINPPAVTTVPTQCNVLTPEVGITSTPVIDPATGTIYVVPKTLESGIYRYRLHALDVRTGAEKFGGPVVIGATVGTDTFGAKDQLNRPGLLLENGHIVLGFGSNGCDAGTYYGWVMSYNASTLAQEAVFDAAPNGTQAAVWMSGDGVASDANGYLYFATGNGTYDPASGDYGNSIVKLNPVAGALFSRADWFTPYNWDYLKDNDLDVGSGGVLLLPDLPSGSAHQHLLVQAGKNGTIYLVDRDHMGENCGTPPCSDNIVQELVGALAGVWNSPAYWNDNVYFGGALDSPASSDFLKAYAFNAGGNGILSPSPTSHTPAAYAWPGPTPSVSSNSTSNGIVWALDNSSFGSSCCAVLHAYDATNLSHELYNSNQVSSRDQPGGAVKFTVPTVANGKVYVGGNGVLAIYGQLQPQALLSPTSVFVSGTTTSPPIYRSLTLANATSSTLTIASIDTSQGNFSVSGGTCGSTLAALASCSITVGFDPSGFPPGTYNDTLVVVDSAPNSPQTASLKATVHCHPGC